MNEGAVRVTLPLRLHVGHRPSEPKHQSSHGSPSALCSPWGRGRQKEQRSKVARRVWLPVIKPRHGCGFRDCKGRKAFFIKGLGANASSLWQQLEFREHSIYWVPPKSTGPGALGKRNTN